jgi:hypothetical protein
MPWRLGVVVSVSAYRPEDREFDSRQGARCMDFIHCNAVYMHRNRHCYCEFAEK